MKNKRVSRQVGERLQDEDGVAAPQRGTVCGQRLIKIENDKSC